jgi:hypothetical protein
MKIEISIDVDKDGAEFVQVVDEAVREILAALKEDQNPRTGSVNDKDGHNIGFVSVSQH